VSALFNGPPRPPALPKPEAKTTNLTLQPPRMLRGRVRLQPYSRPTLVTKVPAYLAHPRLPRPALPALVPAVASCSASQRPPAQLQAPPTVKFAEPDSAASFSWRAEPASSGPACSMYIHSGRQ